jgi:predicted transcriptional regulator
MTTTSLKLPEDLKRRTIDAAEQLGVSPHAFMVDAIARATERTERRTAFVVEAAARLADMRKTGKGVPADQVHDYLKERIAGNKPRKPRGGSWRS